MVASLSALLEVDRVSIRSAIGTPANDTNDADRLRCVKSLTLEILSECARQHAWVDQLTPLVGKRTDIDARLP
jgi:hypothetical protein